MSDSTQNERVACDVRGDNPSGVHRQVSEFRPDWRWRRARHLVQQEMPMSKLLDDELVAWARYAFRQFQLGPRELRLFRRKMPHLHTAVRIYADGGYMKDQLEAAILTEADGQTIGNFFGMPEAVAALYEKLFFAVRDVTCHPGLIISAVIRPALDQGITGDDGGVMKIVAYFFGWDMFRNFLMVGTLPGAQQRKLEGIIHSELTKGVFASALRDRSWTPARSRTAGRSLGAFGGELATCGMTEEELDEQELAKRIIRGIEFHKSSTGPPPIGSVESRAIEGIYLRGEASPTPERKQPEDGNEKPTPEYGPEQDV